MRKFQYTKNNHRKPDIETDLITFVYDLPCLGEHRVFPPYQVLNAIFKAGICPGKASPQTQWQPFSITEDEYDELVWLVQSVDPQSLSQQARFTQGPFEFDYQLNGLNHPQAWLEQVRVKHGTKKPVDIRSRINFYSVSDDWGIFSNFALYPIHLKGKTWPTSEHYFQAQKFEDPGVREKVRKAPTPMEAAHLGRSRKSKLRRDWESVKVDIMAEALYAKFTQHPELKTQLLASGSALIVEHTDQDHFWGDGKGKGRNMLGKLLIQLRDKLNQEV